MAKTCSVERNKKRERMTKNHAARRARLKDIVKDRDVAPEDRFQAMLTLAEMPRNGAKTRIRNRCALTGRSRGYFRKFNLCRNKLRELASLGELPGVTKSSW
jgi:small subunit ribosomal protein S14